MAGSMVYLGGTHILAEGTPGVLTYLGGVHVMGVGVPGALVYLGGVQVMWGDAPTGTPKLDLKSWKNMSWGLK
jgi:hypothetical protein